FIELDIDDGETRHRNGTNAIVRWSARVDERVLSDFFLDRARNLLLHFVRADARPGSKRHRHANGNVRILALRHGVIAIPAPQDRANQQIPGDWWMRHEETGSVMCVLDEFRVTLVSHESAFVD